MEDLPTGEDDRVEARTHRNIHGTYFTRHFLVPEEYLYRETRLPTEAMMPRPPGEVPEDPEHGKLHFGVYGQLTSVATRYKQKDKRDGYHFHMVITRNGISLQVWFFESDEAEVNKVFKFFSKEVKREPKPYYCIKFPRVGKRYHSTQQDNHKTSISFSSFKQVFEMKIINKPVAGSRVNAEQMNFADKLPPPSASGKPKTRKTDAKFNRKGGIDADQRTLGFPVIRVKPRHPEDPEGLLDHSETEGHLSETEERSSSTEGSTRSSRRKKRQRVIDSAESDDESERPLRHTRSTTQPMDEVRPQPRSPGPSTPGSSAPGPSRRVEQAEEVVQLD